MIKKSPKKTVILKVNLVIPVYRDSENIRLLIHRLLAQWMDKSVLEKIIVLSDPGKSVTNRIVSNMFNPRVVLVSENHRPQPHTLLNRLHRYFTGDILVLVDNETLPRDRFVLKDLIDPFITAKNFKIGLVLGQPALSDPESFKEHFHYHYHRLVNNINQSWKSGLNVYSAECRYWRALPGTVVKDLSWPENIPVDDYLYFKIRNSGLKIVQSQAGVLLPNTPDVKKRLPRHLEFPAYINNLKEVFPDLDPAAEYVIPQDLVVKEVLESLHKHPFWTLAVITERFMKRIYHRWFMTTLVMPV